MVEGDEQLYVFALAEPGLPRTIHVLGRRLHGLSLGGFDAIVERGRSRDEPSTDLLRQQHAIVDALARRTRALLPARFGSLVPSDTLRGIAASRQSGILEALARVRGRQQMTIRVFGAADRARSADDRASTGTAYLNRRRARAHQVPDDVRAIRGALRSLVAAERVEPGQGALRVTIYHLVSTADISSYLTATAAIDIAPHGLRVSGPWPAFAFAPELF